VATCRTIDCTIGSSAGSTSGVDETGALGLAQEQFSTFEQVVLYHRIMTEQFVVGQQVSFICCCRKGLLKSWLLRRWGISSACGGDSDTRFSSSPTMSQGRVRLAALRRTANVRFRFGSSLSFSVEMDSSASSVGFCMIICDRIVSVEMKSLASSLGSCILK
jgi:hypothetical protein